MNLAEAITTAGVFALVLSLVYLIHIKREYRETHAWDKARYEAREEEVSNLLWLLREEIGFEFDFDETMLDAIEVYRNNKEDTDKLQEAIKVLTSNQKP